MRPGWWIGLFFLTLLGLCLLSSTASAAKAPHDKSDLERYEGGVSDELEKEAHHEEQGLFGWAMDLAIWTVIVFLVLLAVLYRFAWGPLLQGLEKREHDIHSAHEEAKKAQAEAQALREKLQEEMSRAQEKVREMIEQGRRDGARIHEEMVAKARADIQADRERLGREMAVARDQAVEQIWTQAAQLATLVSSKVLRRQLGPDDHRQLIDEALVDLRQAAEHDGTNGRS